MNSNKNIHSDFVGLENLKKKQGDQLQLFEQFAAERRWTKFHESHYDWWTFPIDKPSRLGFAYTVFEDEIETLKQDLQFMKNYIRGVDLLMLAWGWDLYKEKEIDDPDPDQTWSDWPIRLSKCAQSLKLFDRPVELASVKKYGSLLLERGADFTFRGNDLKHAFLNL
jgi:hypothetical protein